MSGTGWYTQTGTEGTYAVKHDNLVAIGGRYFPKLHMAQDIGTVRVLSKPSLRANEYAGSPIIKMW